MSEYVDPPCPKCGGTDYTVISHISIKCYCGQKGSRKEMYNRATYEIHWEIEWDSVMSHENILEVYIDTVNKIDDYFEYRNQSELDKDFVRTVLKEHTQKLLELAGKDNE